MSPSALANHFGSTTAIVTGGGSGIGAALAGHLVAAGARVVLADLDGDAAQRVASGLKGPGAATARSVDVADGEAVRTLVEEVDADGGLDFLFNNAGISRGGPIEWLTSDDWDRLIAVNLTGVVNGVRAAYPLMRERGGGHIVNTASAAGLVAPPFTAGYAATKAAVVGLSTSLRLEAALHGVRVSVVCPGMVETPILDQAGTGGPEGGVTAREFLAVAKLKPAPVERFARSVLRDVARNRGVIVHPGLSRAQWRLHRWAPGLVDRMLASLARKVDAQLVVPARGERAQQAEREVGA
jgi:NAD(P)-dependent dehydrogenase (short-subunit alcohol dehydrogenase family)